MDRYNKAFESKPSHDDFYTKPAIISAFKNYLSHVVPRYVNNPAVLAWELANDPRCSSTIHASQSCNTTTITKWVANICTFPQPTSFSYGIPNYSCSGLCQESGLESFGHSRVSLRSSYINVGSLYLYSVTVASIVTVARSHMHRLAPKSKAHPVVQHLMVHMA